MSMEVDFSTPLTEQERAYLLERGKYGDIERADSVHGVTPPPDSGGDGTGLRPMSVLSSEVAARRKEDLLAELRAMEAAEAGTSDDDEAVPYESWKLAELQDEAKRRQLDANGTKQVLADRLYADDESSNAQA